MVHKTYMLWSLVRLHHFDGEPQITAWELTEASGQETTIHGQFRACKENIERGDLIMCIDATVNHLSGECVTTQWPQNKTLRGHAAALQVNALLDQIGMPPMFIDEFNGIHPELVPA